MKVIPSVMTMVFGCLEVGASGREGLGGCISNVRDVGDPWEGTRKVEVRSG